MENKNTTGKAAGKKTLVEIQNLKQYFAVAGSLFQKRYVKAVDDVSFHIEEGRPLASLVNRLRKNNNGSIDAAPVRTHQRKNPL